MTKLNYIFLLARYPTLKSFILACYRNNEHTKLIDFIIALETEDKLYIN